MGVHAAPGGYFTVSWTGRLYSCGQALGLWQYPCNDKSPFPFTSPDPCPGPAPDLECEVADNTPTAHGSKCSEEEVTEPGTFQKDMNK